MQGKSWAKSEDSLSIRPDAQPGAERIASPFALSFSDYFARQKIAILADLGPSITSELADLLAQGPHIPKQGRVMARLDTSPPTNNLRAG